MTMFIDWDDIRKEREDARRNAKTYPPGMPSEQLIRGALITLSPNKQTGSRSYADDIHEVLSANAGHVVLRSTGLCRRTDGNGIFAVCIFEHEFYPAEALANAIRDEQEASGPADRPMREEDEMGDLSWMSDDALAASLAEARDAAHNAPRAPHSTAWARRSREYFRFLEETRRRQIAQPPPLEPGLNGSAAVGS